MAVKTVKVGDITLDFDTSITRDMRFTRLMGKISNEKRSEQARLVDFTNLCDFLFGEENVDMIIDELAKENGGHCTDEQFMEWLSDVLGGIEEVKN